MCLGTIGAITEVWDSGGVPLARVGIGPAAETVCLLGCPGAQPGTRVLVHAGFVVEVLSPDIAAEAERLRATPGAGDQPDTHPSEPEDEKGRS